MGKIFKAVSSMYIAFGKKGKTKKQGFFKHNKHKI